MHQTFRDLQHYAALIGRGVTLQVDANGKWAVTEGLMSPLPFSGGAKIDLDNPEHAATALAVRKRALLKKEALETDNRERERITLLANLSVIE